MWRDIERVQRNIEIVIRKWWFLAVFILMDAIPPIVEKKYILLRWVWSFTTCLLTPFWNEYLPHPTNADIALRPHALSSGPRGVVKNLFFSSLQSY